MSERHAIASPAPSSTGSSGSGAADSAVTGRSSSRARGSAMSDSTVSGASSSGTDDGWPSAASTDTEASQLML